MVNHVYRRLWFKVFISWASNHGKGPWTMVGPMIHRYGQRLTLRQFPKMFLKRIPRALLQLVVRIMARERSRGLKVRSWWSLPGGHKCQYGPWGGPQPVKGLVVHLFLERAETMGRSTYPRPYRSPWTLPLFTGSGGFPVVIWKYGFLGAIMCPP